MSHRRLQAHVIDKKLNAAWVRVPLWPRAERVCGDWER